MWTTIRRNQGMYYQKDWFYIDCKLFSEHTEGLKKVTEGLKKVTVPCSCF